MHDHNHNDFMKAVSEEYQDIFENSEQGIYVYLDDVNKVCNKKFAELLGYDSPEEWAKIEESFPQVFVDEGSQETLVNAYQDAMEKGNASTNKIVWKKKDGETVKTSVILAPISFEGHLLAIHFVS